jgi:hypothetical protein
MSIRQMPKVCPCLRIYLLGPYSPFDNVINRNRTVNICRKRGLQLAANFLQLGVER